MVKYLLRLFFVSNIIFFACAFNRAHAQRPVTLNDTITQHPFSYDEMVHFEDPTGKLTLDDIKKPEYASRFKKSGLYPTTSDPHTTYWYRIAINHAGFTKNGYLIEFFDQTIDDITVYAPTVNHKGYLVSEFGSKFHFNQRLFQHKNFTLILDKNVYGNQIYYIRVKSHLPSNVIVVLRSVGWFIHYALDEYFFFGVFYGMLLVFGL